MKNNIEYKVNFIFKKAAFTLAEVLITLGIIGVIAAMTIPILIGKYNEMVIVNELKKTYSELQQVIKLSESENGSFTNWDYPKNYTEVDSFLQKYILPYYKSFNKCVRFSCYGKNSGYTYKTLDGEPSNDKHFLPWYLVNNKLMFVNGANISDGIPIKYVTFFIDVDGSRGDTRMGKDLFVFTLFNYAYQTGSWVYTDTCPRGEHYGLYLGATSGYWGGYCGSLEGILGADSVRGDCKKQGGGNNCALAIQKNGWKIPKNYPIKF